jgi:hypothetical protein
MRGSDLSPQTSRRWSKSAALSTDDKESRNHQHNVRDEGRRKWLALFTLSSSASPSSSGSFGHDTFQLDVELVDNRLLLRIRASDVDRFRGKVAARAFILFVCCDESGGVSNQTQRAKRVGCVLTVMSRNIHQMSPKTNALGEFQGAWPGLTSANLISFARIGAHAIRAEKVK